MAVAQQYVARQSGGRGGPSGLADVLDVLLDKGLVIDAFVRVSLVGIELLTVDARIVIAGVDTYLHFAEAVNRLDLLQQSSSQTLPDVVSGRGNGSRNNGDGAPSQQRKSLENDGPDQSGPDQSGADQGGTDQGGTGEDNGENGGGKGLLSRLVDRGQAF